MPEANSPTTSRVVTFDLMRGYFLIVILCDHLALYPSIFDAASGRALLWVTAAEGFFFISGLLVGLTRRGLFERRGLGAVMRKLWSRALKLYVATIVLTVLFSNLGYWLDAQHVAGVKTGLVYFDGPLQLIGHAASFDYSYGYTDFLIYYVIYLLLSPAIIWLLTKRRGWLGVAGLCGLLWLGKFGVNDPKVIQYLTWGTYFFAGTTLGYHYQTIIQRWRDTPTQKRRAWRRRVVWWAGATAVVSVVATFGGPVAGYISRLPGYDLLFSYNRGGLLRPAIFALWFAALWVVVRRYQAAIIRRAGHLLVPLGQRSLYVYIIESFIVFALPLAGLPSQFVVNSLLDITAIATIWLAARYHILGRIIPN